MLILYCLGNNDKIKTFLHVQYRHKLKITFDPQLVETADIVPMDKGPMVLSDVTLDMLTAIFTFLLLLVSTADSGFCPSQIPKPSCLKTD